MTDRINPIRITDNESGETYELGFSRDSVEFAENRGFVLEDVAKFPATKVPELWYYAFRMNHKGKSRTQTDALLHRMGGLTVKALERLVLLYQQAQMSNNIQDEEDLEKNGAVTVEL